MKPSEFRKKVNEGLAEIKQKYGNDLENVQQQCRHMGNVFQYAAWCEQNFQDNLREDYKSKTTFTSDLSIAEWCAAVEGVEAVIDTFRRCTIDWKDDIEYFAELVIAVNLKSWEHHARGNDKWALLYANLYYLATKMYLEWFKDNDEAFQYYMDYVD